MLRNVSKRLQLKRLRLAREVYKKLFEDLPDDHPSAQYDYQWEAHVGHWTWAILDGMTFAGPRPDLVAYAKTVLGEDHEAWLHVETEEDKDDD